MKNNVIVINAEDLVGKDDRVKNELNITIPEEKILDTCIMVNYISAWSKIDKDTVNKVLELETKYMIENGFAQVE